MDGPLKIPHLSYNQLREYAEAFLAQYHPSRGIPVPIEKIVEFQLNTNIVPIPGLMNTFQVDGFTSSDLKEISVDLGILEQNPPNRYRFTLAHEVGHVVLHAGLFQEHTFRTGDEWKKFVKTFPDLDLSRLEWQAHGFAGLVLVPPDALKQIAPETIRQVKAKGLSREKDFARDLIVDMMATRFEVSKAVIERRLGYDNLNLATLW